MNLELTYWSGKLQGENGALARYGFNLDTARILPRFDMGIF
jgi:hypothetical protein